MQVGPEAEFFLFRLDGEGNPTVDPHDAASYFDVAPMDKGEDCRRDIEVTLQQMGFHLEAAHHEVAIGQHEIDFRHGDALSTADNLITFRMVVKVIAAQHGMHATFMAKPLHGENGSGMHVNQSLSRGDENAFLDESDDLKLSKEAYSYIAGILGHLPAITAVANPTVNSYKRLLPGYEAPVYIAWSPGNRSAAIRVPAKRGRSTRIELRTPDPTANPYLALACMLQAGLDGIVNGHTPPAPVNRNIYDLTEEESVQFGITSLPHDLPRALDALEADTVVQEALGEHIFSEYMRLKRGEWAIYNEQVHKWEIDEYMDRY
jgi:glutamine synthetase